MKNSGITLFLIAFAMGVCACAQLSGSKVDDETVFVTNNPQNVHRFNGQLVTSITKDGMHHSVVDDSGMRVVSSSPTSTFVVRSRDQTMTAITSQDVVVKNLEMKWAVHESGSVVLQGLNFGEVSSDGASIQAAQAHRIEHEVRAVIAMSEDAREAYVEQLKITEGLLGEMVEAIAKVILSKPL